ncbi:hypothetical protein AVEN_261440-1 [Araneus ventricosus]|uniref:Uncharacterized protein n=1 Tax=Araneus ventricosus TaxID=182803 RepID=A0A4Y2TQE7_ARAVE|nr:hypothetical protein AVEN_261440-1 [Araneus ventricosus]
MFCNSRFVLVVVQLTPQSRQVATVDLVSVWGFKLILIGISAKMPDKLPKSANIAPQSCDTFVALPPATALNCVVFGKNSDRPKGEVQEVVYFPSENHPAGAKVQVRNDLWQ